MQISWKWLIVIVDLNGVKFRTGGGVGHKWGTSDLIAFKIFLGIFGAL